MPKVPYTSVTETVARILSLLISLLCFSIYILSKDIQIIKLDWSMLMVHLIVFWLAYEIFAFCFFLLLQQFAATKDPKQEQIPQKIEDKAESISPVFVEPTDDFDK